MDNNRLKVDVILELQHAVRTAQSKLAVLDALDADRSHPGRFDILDQRVTMRDSLVNLAGALDRARKIVGDTEL